MREALLTTDKFCCPHCGVWRSKVVDSRPDKEGLRYIRWRHCSGCHQMFETAEQATGKKIPLQAESDGIADSSVHPFPQRSA